MRSEHLVTVFLFCLLTALGATSSGEQRATALCPVEMESGSAPWATPNGVCGTTDTPDTFLRILPAASITSAHLTGQETRVGEVKHTTVWSS